MRSRRSPTRAAIVATLLASSRAGAQQQGEIAISAGTATDQRGVHSNAITFAPSVLVVPTPSTALSVGASISRFDDASSLGGAGLLSGRQPLAWHSALAIDASGAVSRFAGEGVSATFASADVMPTLELSLRPLTLFGGARAAVGHASRVIARQPLPLFGGNENESRTVSGAGPTFGASVVTVAPSGATLRVSARSDVLRVSDVTVADHVLSAGVGAGGLALSGSIGQRMARDERVGFGSGAISLALTRNVALEGGAGRYASNRLTGTPGGDYVNIGLAVRFGGSRLPARSVLVARGAPRLARGFTRLAIEAPGAERVDVAGDFNDWTPMPTRRAENGVWYADLRIPAGQYRYAFRVNARDWRVPRGATAVNDGFGGKSAWLTVAETGR